MSRLGSPPHFSIFLSATHQQSNRVPNLFTLHHLTPKLVPVSPFLGSHRHPNSEHIHHQLLVEKMLGKQRPRHHGQPSIHALNNRVPTAVSNQSSNRWILQYQQLRRPTPY
ncbi:hypothetical protein CR513_41493, partial [Mucuna pruriens]